MLNKTFRYFKILFKNRLIYDNGLSINKTFFYFKINNLVIILSDNMKINLNKIETIFE